MLKLTNIKPFYFIEGINNQFESALVGDEYNISG